MMFQPTKADLKFRVAKQFDKHQVCRLEDPKDPWYWPGETSKNPVAPVEVGSLSCFNRLSYILISKMADFYMIFCFQANFLEVFLRAF